MSHLWTIQRLAPGGDGFTRLADGRAAFASGALPGDQVRVHELRERRGYVRALTWELVASGDARVEPDCELASQCGGCNWMSLRRESQLESKARLIGEALRRGAGLYVNDIFVHRSPRFEGYRCRARFHLGDRGEVGFRARGKSEIVDVPNCKVCTTELNRALLVLRDASRRHPHWCRVYESVEIRTPPGQEPLYIFWPRKSFASALRVLQGAGLGSQTVYVMGSSHGVEQRWPLREGLYLSIPATGFSQTNWDVNLALIDAVLDLARESGATTFCDLYCGAGNFAIPLLGRGLSGVALDGSASAVAAGERAAAAQRLQGCQWVAGKLTRGLSEITSQGRHFDLVLVDPPRAGARQILSTLVELAPAQLILCSCDPATLARDLRPLMRAGYSLQSLCGFDMFPHTHHVEVLAYLSK